MAKRKTSQQQQLAQPLMQATDRESRPLEKRVRNAARAFSPSVDRTPKKSKLDLTPTKVVSAPAVNGSNGAAKDGQVKRASRHAILAVLPASPTSSRSKTVDSSHRSSPGSLISDGSTDGDSDDEPVMRVRRLLTRNRPVNVTQHDDDTESEGEDSIKENADEPLDTDQRPGRAGNHTRTLSSPGSLLSRRSARHADRSSSRHSMRSTSSTRRTPVPTPIVVQPGRIPRNVIKYTSISLNQKAKNEKGANARAEAKQIKKREKSQRVANQLKGVAKIVKRYVKKARKSAQEMREEAMARKREKEQAAKKKILEADTENFDHYKPAVAGKKVLEEILPQIDRKTGGVWDKSWEQRKKMEKKVTKEGIMKDFPTNIKQEYMKKTIEECTAKRINVPVGVIKSLFWKILMLRECVGHRTHTPMNCHEIWIKKNSGSVWYCEEFCTVYRLILIGALCEKCQNPFKYSAEDLARTRCTCPKIGDPKWEAPRMSKWSGRVAHLKSEAEKKAWLENKRQELWWKKKDQQRQCFYTGMRINLKRQYPTNFATTFPYAEVDMSARTDQYGMDCWAEENKLNRVRMLKNQPPTFIISWVDTTSGDIGIPHRWIADQDTELSDDVVKELSARRRAHNYASTHCTGTCTDSHSCCDSGFKTNFLFNSKGLLQHKSGLYPGGIDDEMVPRQGYEMDASMVVCDANCQCSAKCPRKTVMNGPKKMVCLFRTPGKDGKESIGWSIRTAEPLARGEYIFSYAGKVITKKELTIDTQDKNMMFDITPEFGWTATKTAPDFILTACIVGSEFKYVNHSCNPNTMIVRIYTRTGGALMHSVGLFARQKINAYEELVYDYYRPTTDPPFDCQCGGYACRGKKK